MRSLFQTRDFFFHDGRTLRRFRVSRSTQIVAASLSLGCVGLASATAAQAGSEAMVLAGLTDAAPTPQAQVAQLEAKLQAKEGEVATIKRIAKQRAERVERRQQFLAAVLSGKGDPERLAALIGPATTAAEAGEVIAPFARIERKQDQLAQLAAAAAEARYAETAAAIARVGMGPRRFVAPNVAMGGPLEEVTERDEIDDEMGEADTNFRTLFRSWKKLDTLQDGVIAIPSYKPVEKLTLTSTFGVRSDPFRGSRAMHAGIDIPGPVGTPIYATADGVVGRSGRYGAYGNLVEVNHGKGIQTRYGHMSRIMVGANVRVKRGQLIGLMGSTGRSTGSHLHYEVRVDGRAINPMPFLQSADYLVQVQDRSGKVLNASATAKGGPAN